MIRILIVVFLSSVASSAEAQSLEQLFVAPSDGSILGVIADLDLLPDGRAVVLDSQAKSVLLFSDDGRLSMELGGPGQGPGEIELGFEVEIGPEGEILVVDAGNARMTNWASDGTLSGSSRFDAILGGAPVWPHELLWNGSALTLKTSHFIPDLPVAFHAIPAEPGGTAELLVTIPVSPPAVTCVFCPTTHDGSGRLIVARGDTLYSVSRLDAAGGLSLTWFRSDLPAARRSAEELARMNAASSRIGAEEGSRGGRGGFSEFKARFGRHSLDVDESGRLWALPSVEDGSPAVLDVFGPEGSFIRSIALGVPATAIRIRGAKLVVASETSIGEPVVRIYEITR